jgi:hypothetical protein
MKPSLLSFVCVVALLVAGCTFNRSLYKRFPLPKGIDQPTAQRVFSGVVQAMRSQPFVDELKKRFPSITQQQLLKTDTRFEWFETSGQRSYFVAFGVKDLSGFPEAEALIDFAIEYGKTEAQKLLPPADAKKG